MLAGVPGGALVAPADLVGRTLLVLEDAQRQWMCWPDWFRLNGVQMPKRVDQIVVNRYAQLLELAVLGQGVAIAWRHIIDGCLEQRLVVRATRESASNGGGYYALVPNDRARSTAARLFTHWLFEQVRLQTGIPLAHA